MTVTVINGPFIQAGESLSDVLDCSAGSLVRLTMPGAWTEAVLSFEISSDGILYNIMYRFDEIYPLVCHVLPGAGILLPEWKGIQFVKFRSGTPQRPVVQTELREFSVALWSP